LAVPVLAGIKKCKKSGSTNHLFLFIPVLTPLPPPPSQPQIIFESRLGTYDVLNDFRMTVKGTYFHILQKGIAKKGNAFGSHKYEGKSALRYELGVDILTGNLVWIQVLYLASKYTNIKQGLVSFR